MSLDKTLTEQDLDQYTIGSRREIVHILTNLIQRAETVTVLFNRGADSFITILLAVDDEEDELIFDWGGSEAVNRRFLQAESCTFQCFPDGVRVQFASGPARATEYGDRRAFAADLPSSLLRLQLREFFRVRVPIARRPPCVLEAEDGQRHAFAVYDLSIGGISFIEVPEAFAAFGTLVRVPRMRLNLGEFGTVQCGLEVRYVTELAAGSGRRLARMGCRFIGITPNAQAHIQRYMSALERERREREADV